MVRLAAVAALFSVLGLPTSGHQFDRQAAPPPAALVAPGRGIGPVRLGMPLSRVVGLLGTPDPQIEASVRPEAPAHTRAWQLKHPPGGPLIVVVDKFDRVASVKTYWNVFYRTTSGLHVGLPEDDAEAEAGAPRRTTSWSHFRLLYYPGLILTVDTDTTIVIGIAVVPARLTAPRRRAATLEPSVGGDR